MTFSCSLCVIRYPRVIRDDAVKKMLVPSGTNSCLMRLEWILTWRNFFHYSTVYFDPIRTISYKKKYHVAYRPSPKANFAAFFRCVAMEAVNCLLILKKTFSSLPLVKSGRSASYCSSDCKNSQMDGIRWEENNKKSVLQGGGSVKFEKRFLNFLKPSPPLLK